MFLLIKPKFEFLESPKMDHLSPIVELALDRSDMSDDAAIADGDSFDGAYGGFDDDDEGDTGYFSPLPIKINNKLL